MCCKYIQVTFEYIHMYHSCIDVAYTLPLSYPVHDLLIPCNILESNAKCMTVY